MLRRFFNQMRELFLGSRAEIDMTDIPGFLQRQREKALLATIIFFIVLTGYQAFGRPYQTPVMFGANLTMFAITIIGLLIVLKGHLRGGLIFTIYAETIVMAGFHYLMILQGLKDPNFRPPITGAFFFGTFTLYMLITASFFLDRRHIRAVGGIGLVYLSLTIVTVRQRVFTDLTLTLLAFISAATILTTYFFDLFEKIQSRLIGLTGNLQAEVETRTGELNERVKEMRCLENVSALTASPAATIESVLAQVAEILPAAFQQPEQVAVRVALGGRERTSPRFRAAGRMTRQEIMVMGERSGLLEVWLQEDARGVAPGLLREEAALLTMVAERLGLFASRLQAERRLWDSKEIAEKANAAKNLFLASVSHELRTPLNSIIGFAELLQRADLPPAARHHAEIIRNAGGSLLELINDLLDLSRIEAGTVEIQPEAVDLRDLLAAVARDFSLEMDRRRLEFRLQVAPAVPRFLRLDRRRLRQVLANLLANAVRCTERGLIEIHAQLESAGPSLIINVIDSGCGIAFADQERIFEIFHKSSGATGGGAGLGLAICRTYVQLMGGTIAVTSAPGQGSIFTVTLPAQPVQPAAARDETSPALPRLQGSCLVVDDVPENRELLRLILEQNGLAVRVAASGEEAVALAAAAPCDLVLLDLLMPEMDGYETLRRLRAMAAWRDRPVIAVTAAAMPAEEAKAKAAGFDDFLKKPVEARRLFATLARFLPPAPSGEPPPRDEAILRREAARLAPAERRELAALLAATLDTGSLGQSEALGRRLEETAGRGGLAALAQLGRTLAARAAECRIMELRELIELTRRVWDGNKE